MERDHVSDLYFLDIPRPPSGDAVNMVESENTMKARFIHFPKKATPALGLHALSTPRLSTSTTTNTIWIHYHTLWVSLRSQGFHPDTATRCSTSTMTSPQSWEKLMSSGSFTNSVTPTAPNAVIRRQKKKKHVVGDPDLKI
jgi:hypothetical protein